MLNKDTEIYEDFDNEFLGDMVILKGNAKKIDDSLDNNLYSYNQYNLKDFIFKAVPYFAWANRGIDEMSVCLNKL